MSALFFCSNCGSKIKDSQKFCNHCGTSIVKKENNNEKKNIWNSINFIGDSNTFAAIGLFFGVILSLFFFLMSIVSIVQGINGVALFFLLLGIIMIFASLMTKLRLNPDKNKRDAAYRYLICAIIILIVGFIIIGVIPAIFLFIASYLAFKEDKRKKF